MAALFYKYSDQGMLKQSVGSGASPGYMPLFEDLINENDLVIINQISVTTVENNQFFLTFDDFIHYYHFGKGVGQISVNGMIFMNCNQAMPGLNAFYLRIAQARGNAYPCVVGGFSFMGLLTDCNVTLSSEPETVASFTANFAVINHDIPNYPTALPTC